MVASATRGRLGKPVAVAHEATEETTGALVKLVCAAHEATEETDTLWCFCDGIVQNNSKSKNLSDDKVSEAAVEEKAAEAVEKRKKKREKMHKKRDKEKFSDEVPILRSTSKHPPPVPTGSASTR